MNDFEYYEDELDAIRNNIFEQIKNMTSEERVNYFNSSARKTAEQYGFNMIKDISDGIYAFEKRIFAGHAHQEGTHEHANIKDFPFPTENRPEG
jgi:hypothetical protein